MPALRNDFFGSTARHDDLHQHFARHRLLIAAMSGSEFEAEIRKPAVVRR